MLARTKGSNHLLALLFAVAIFQFALIPELAHAELSEIIIDEDESMAVVPLPENYMFTGAARHNIAIDVPPGRNGIHPNLFLSYNSVRKNGWIGVGWRLSESAIRRSTKHGLNFNGTDFVFERNGRQSEMTSRSDWGTDYYGAKIESEFTKFQLIGVSQGWKVIARDGTTYFYGQTAASRQDDPGDSNRVYKWCLDRVQDTNGNYMTFAYFKDQGQIYLKQIDYTGNTNAGAAGRYQVKFELADRSDVSISYKSRFAVTTAKRLDRIEVYYDTVLVRKYQLDYEYGASSGCSRLNKLQTYGTDGSSLPPKTFEWKEGGSGAITYKGLAGLIGNNFNFADLNGDGYADVIARRLVIDNNDGSSEYRTYVSTLMNTAQWADDSGSKFSGGDTFEITSASSIYNSELAPIGLGDINGDGLADLVTIDNAWISMGDGSFINPPNSPTTPTENIYVGDVNGDGLTDVVGDTVVGTYYWNHDITVHVSNGDGTFGKTSSIFQESGSRLGDYPEEPTINLLHLADINGDGYADLIKVEEDTLWDTLWIYISKGNGTFESEYSFSLPKKATSISFADVNGDGLTDLIFRFNEPWGGMYWNSYVYVYLSKGNGGFDGPRLIQIAYHVYSPPRSMSVGDINGDGRADLVVGNPGSGVSTYLATANGHFAGALNTAPESSDGIILTDINGDERADLVDYRLYTMEYFLSDGSSPQPDLLSKIKAGTGATMTIGYDSSSAHYNPRLPFIFQLVSTITVNDGVGPDSTTTYDTYSEGLYDYSDRDFRGFRFAKQTNPDHSIVEKYYHQDDYRKGNEQQVILKDPNENILTDTNLTWQEIDEHQTWGFVKLNRKRVDYYNSPNVFSQEDYAYHPDNGYLHTVTASGDGAESITTITEYVNKGDWVWRLAEETLKNSSGDTIRRTKYTYQDATGNRLSTEQVLDPADAGQNPVTGYGYDPYGYGNLTSETDPRGNPTVVEYDSETHTHPAKVIYPQTGCGTPAGCVDHVVEYTYDYSFGKVSDKKDENGNWTTYDYDSFGRLVKVIYPDGGLKTIDYFDEASPRYVLTKIRESDTSTIDTLTYYDGLNRRIETITYGEDDRTVITLWRYDNMGRQDRIDGPFLTNLTSYLDRDSLPVNIPFRQTTFDHRGRPLNIEQPLGSSVEGGGSAFTNYAYRGFSVTVTDPDGSMKKTRRDFLGRIREVVEYTDQGEQHTFYDYNAAGDLTQVINHLNHTTTIEYDNLGRKISMTDPDMGYWQYPEHDKNGNLIRQVDAKNQEIQFSYDQLNRMTDKSYSTADLPVKYIYDDQTIPNGIGRLYSAFRGETEESITTSTTYDAYDEMGRVLSVTKKIAGAPSPSYTTTYEYDKSGKVVGMTYPDTYQLLYDYHPKSGLLYQVTGPEPDRELHAELTLYGPTGKIGHVYYGNNTQSEYNYDPESNRLLSIQSKDTALNLIQDKGYKYSPAGDIKQIANNLSGVTYSYTYDKLHRLKSETNDGASDPFAPVMLESSFSAAAPLHAADQIEFNGASFTYSYDENGNMTAGPDFTDPAQSAIRTITYNADNMPVSIVREKGASSNTIEFDYDGESKRVKKVVNSLSETYYIGEHFEVRDGIETKYIFAGNLRIAKITSSNGYYYHKDHLGSSTVMTNYPDGEAAESTEYLPFGRDRTKPGINLTSFKFTDQEWDNESGLYNYDARLYDPVIGRFISADLIVQKIFDPQILNRYSYVRNNPLIYNDPTGFYIPELGQADHRSDEKNNSDFERRLSNDIKFADEKQIVGEGTASQIRDKKAELYGWVLNEMDGLSWRVKEKRMKSYVVKNYSYYTGVTRPRLKEPSPAIVRELAKDYLGNEPWELRVERTTKEIQWWCREIGKPSDSWWQTIITGEKFIDVLMWEAFVFAPMEFVELTTLIDENPVDAWPPFEN